MEYYKYEHYDVTLSDCEFGDSWEAETACSKACGGGVQILTRTRARNASGNGLACQGENTRLGHCNQNLCPWVIMIIVVLLLLISALLAFFCFRHKYSPLNGPTVSFKMPNIIRLGK